jgi:hypothetical protein
VPEHSRPRPKNQIKSPVSNCQTKEVFEASARSSRRGRGPTTEARAQRTLDLITIPEVERLALVSVGNDYLRKIRVIDRTGLALASYEDGGLEKVFRAIPTAQHWSGRHRTTAHVF